MLQHRQKPDFSFLFSSGSTLFLLVFVQLGPVLEV